MVRLRTAASLMASREIIMNLANETYLREVQAFPQTSSGRTSVMDAPAEVDKKQLDELGIKVIESAKEKESKK